MKAVNVATANEFHVWQREYLPPGIVVQDIDSWALCLSDAESRKPRALLELKRSSIPVEEWWPFQQDTPNYACLHALAREAGVEFLIVYFEKGQTITPHTWFAVFRVTSVDSAPHGVRRLLTAAEFAERWR